MEAVGVVSVIVILWYIRNLHARIAWLQRQNIELKRQIQIPPE